METIGIGILSLMALITMVSGGALYIINKRRENKKWGNNAK